VLGPLSSSNHDGASFITQETVEQIIKIWIARVQKEMPVLSNYSEKILTSGLSDFLRTFVDMLAMHSLDQDSFHKNIFNSRAHGMSRANIPTYTLEQVIKEYRILRATIFMVLEKESPLPLADRDILLESIDNGMTEAATEFALLRGFSDARLSDARLSDAVTAKNVAVKELGVAHAAAITAKENFGLERDARVSFVLALSHDLRNPLTAALMSTQLIERNPSNLEMVIKCSARAIKSIERTDKMISNLLDSSLIHNGDEMALYKSRCDLNDLLQNTVADLSIIYGERFVIRSSGRVLGEFDSDGIRRVIENLLTNAIKYGSPQKPVTVTLEQNNKSIILSVHNEGNVISESDQKTLFQQFRRTEDAHLGDKKGWGLGLTLVRGIVEAHGGTVKVQSTLSEGTIFRVTLSN
jgi:signal transduction histidine kinase